MVCALALEGTATADAVGRYCWRQLPMHVAVLAAEMRLPLRNHHHSALNQRPHHPQGDGLPAGQLLGLDQRGSAARLVTPGADQHG